MFRFIGASALTVVAVVLILVVVAVPLLLVYRSGCPDDGGLATRYSFVLPWNDPPQECRNHQQGFEVLTEEVGL
jgi:hypothetical protein